MVFEDERNDKNNRECPGERDLLWVGSIVLISILSQIEKGKILTHKQKQILGRVIEQNSESEARKLEGWKAEYFSKFQDTAIKISYYHSYYPYYGDMARDILDGKVPRKKKFMKMYNNKYSKRF